MIKISYIPININIFLYPWYCLGQLLYVGEKKRSINWKCEEQINHCIYISFSLTNANIGTASNLLAQLKYRY